MKPEISDWIKKAGGCFISCQRMGQGTKSSHDRETEISKKHGARRVIDFNRHWSHGNIYAVLDCGCHVALNWLPYWQRVQCETFLRRIKEVFPEYKVV